MFIFIVKIHDPPSEFGRIYREKSEPIWGHILQSEQAEGDARFMLLIGYCA